MLSMALHLVDPYKMRNKYTILVVLDVYLNLLDYSLECENLVLRISDTARRKVISMHPRLHSILQKLTIPSEKHSSSAQE
jgi:hypothetical protein